MISWDAITMADLIDSGEANLQTGPFGMQLKASEYVALGIPVINVKNPKSTDKTVKSTVSINKYGLFRDSSFSLMGERSIGRQSA